MGLTDDITFISVFIALIALGTQVLEKFALLLLNINKNWSTGSLELVDYSKNVKALERRVAEWEHSFKKFGMSDRPALKDRLDEARRLWKIEQQRSSDLDASPLKKWKRRVASIAAPNELSSSIKRVNDAFEEIARILIEGGTIGDTIGKFRRWEPAKLSFQKYKCYTANVESEELVKQQLENDADIVVLCGEPGSGKTCLAKHLGLDYEKEQLDPLFPDGVFLVDCGSGAEVTKLYQKLLRDLGIAGPGEEGSGFAQDSPDTDSLRKELEGGLYELDALIIVDGVSDASILDALIVPKKPDDPERPKVGRKYLVTTRNANCIPARGDLDLRLVKMKRMDHEGATTLLLRRIVQNETDASAVANLRAQIETSPDLQDLPGRMIKETNCNPQALVCFAELLRSRVLYQERWLELLDSEGELFSTLDNEEIAKRAGTSTTVFKSMIASVEILRGEHPHALDLLLFLSLCDTPVPETVLRSISCFLDKKQATDQGTKARKRLSMTSSLDILENGSLVDHYLMEAPWNDQKRESVQDQQQRRSEHEQNMYEVPSLRRQIILKGMREEWQSLITKLLTTVPDPSADGPSEGDLVAVLFAAYGDKTREELVLALEGVRINMHIVTEFKTQFETRRSFVEEAVRLLHSELEGSEPKRSAQQRNGKNPARGTTTQKREAQKDDKNREKMILQKEAHKLGKKVIVQALSEGSVDNDDISKLLQLSEPFPLIVCRALKVLLAPDPAQKQPEQSLESTSDNHEGSEQRNSTVIQHMRGLKPTTLFSYIENMKEGGKTPSTLVQLKALEVVRGYIDKAKGRRQEIDHFVHFVDITSTTGVEKSTLDALFALLDHNKSIEDELQTVKVTLSKRNEFQDVTLTPSRRKELEDDFRRILIDGLQNIQNLHLDSAVEAAVNEVVPQMESNLKEELPPLEKLGKSLDEALDRVKQIRDVSVDIVQKLQDFFPAEEQEKWKIKSKLLELSADRSPSISTSESHELTIEIREP